MVDLSRDNRTAEKRSFDDANGVVVFDGLLAPGYVDSYARATRLLADSAWAAGELCNVALPLFFLQRHTLELCLKDIIGALMDIAELKEEVAAPTDEDYRKILARRETADRKHLFTHDTDALLAIAEQYVGASGVLLPKEFYDVAAMVRDFELGRAERARYDRVKRRKREPNSVTNSLPGFLGTPVSLPIGEIQRVLQKLISTHMWIDNGRDDCGFMNELLLEVEKLVRELERLER